MRRPQEHVGLTAPWWLAAIVLLLTGGRAALAAKLNVAVFNFQMKSDTPEWVWLEKGLADQITTDFTQSQRLTVVARDEMQILAAQLKWTPELATGNPDAMAQARKQLKIDRLITGTFTFDGEKIELTAQVIDVQTRKELTRRTLAGRASDVLSLQRNLSAQLLGWFSDVPPEEILPHLPVWTTSIEATRGLYEGLHLYDQGRYAEAWLKFRQAWRTDPTYLEAHYWVGRMYYFMDRYEHARRAYEKFVYMDAAHPRIGDAIREYLHTYEKLNTPPETMLALYADFLRRFGDRLVYNVLDLPGAISTRAWLRARSACILGSLGRHAEATELSSAAVGEIRAGQNYLGTVVNGACAIAMDNAYRHNLQTAQVLVPEGLLAHHRYGANTCVVRFAPGQREASYLATEPNTGYSINEDNGRKYYPDVFQWHFLLAPDGYVFRKITAYPIVQGDGVMGCCLHKHYFTDVGAARRAQAPQAARDGFVFEGLPPSGIFQIHTFFTANDRYRDPHYDYRGMRVVAEFDKVAAHGALDVRCTSLEYFRVYLQDGRLGRVGPGLIGLLPPGPQVLEVQGTGAQQPRKVEVNVVAGQTQRVDVPLDWDPKGPWREWSGGVLVGRDYPPRVAALNSDGGSLSILPGPDGIRLYWSFEGDLWTAWSTDAKTFTPPQRLGLPVSSGWYEGSPRVIRDESGRVLLAFLSDREAQHNRRAYLCWSRNGVNWSSPAMVIDRTLSSYDITQGVDGTFLWVAAEKNDIRVLRSPDAFAWETAARIPWKGRPDDVRLLCRADGTYELIVASTEFREQQGERAARETGMTTVLRLCSPDGATWSAPQRVTQMGIGRGTSLSAVGTPSGTVLAVFREEISSHLEFFREAPDGTWAGSPPQPGLGALGGAIAWSPAWGFLLAWQGVPTLQFPSEPAGPFLLRGPTIDPLLERK